MTVRILTRANVPDELANAWLQHLRDFDSAHPGCHFEILADAPDMALADVMKVLTVDPPLPFGGVFKKSEAADG